MKDKKNSDNIETPATIPSTNGEWVITVNGRAVPETNSRQPTHDLPIDGKTESNIQLDNNPAVLEIRFGESGINDVQIHHQFGNCTYEITYKLTPEECDESGKRWTTASHDPEATVEFLPPSEFDVL